MRSSGFTTDTTLTWERTFHQRKAHLAKDWENGTEYRRKMLLEQVILYSGITIIKEL